MKDDKMNEEDGRDEWYTWKMAIWMMRHDKMTNEERYTQRHDIFPEDDILDIVTISRYNYHK